QPMLVGTAGDCPRKRNISAPPLARIMAAIPAGCRMVISTAGPGIQQLLAAFLQAHLGFSIWLEMVGNGRPLRLRRLRVLNRFLSIRVIPRISLTSSISF